MQNEAHSTSLLSMSALKNFWQSMFLFLVKQIIAIDNFVAIIYITFLNSDLTAILNLYIIYSMYGFI